MAYARRQRVSGELTCGGGDTMQELVEAWAQEFHRYQPDAVVNARHDTRLSADGFAALLNGAIDVVTFVREPFDAEIASFKAKFGYELTLVNVAGGSYATKGGTHAIAIFVNAKNPLAHLDLQQLDSIFSAERRRGALSRATQWEQLGLGGREWAGRRIHAYGMLHKRESGNPPGIVNFLKQRIMLGGEFARDVIEQTDRAGETALQGIVNRVAEDADGIGYSGFGYATQGVRTVALGESASGPFYAGTEDEVSRRLYPLSRQIYLGFNLAPDQRVPPLLREFIRFVLSGEGQQIVADNHMHFIPLSPAQAAAASRPLDGRR